MKHDLALVTLKCGDLIQIVESYLLGKTVMHDCIIVASHEGREGGQFRLTARELGYNAKG